MKRKTIEVNLIKERVNLLLADKTHSVEFKEGVIAMLEFTLHRTDNYNGFMYNETYNDFKPGTPEHVNRKYY